MDQKTVNINNFIGVYDNYIPEQECNNAIKLYEEQDKFNRTVNRIAFEKASTLNKQDQQFFAGANNLDLWWEQLKPILVNFDIAWNDYVKNTGADHAYLDKPFHFTCVKIQKTLPTEGYHVWHIEHGQGFDMNQELLYFLYI